MAGLIKSLFGKKEPHEQAEVQPSAPTLAVGAAEPFDVTDATFERLVLQSPVPTLVDVWAPWCGPCRMLVPIVEELAQKYRGRVAFAKINADDNLRLASDLDIVGVPTLILFNGGQEVDRLVGYAPRHLLEEHLAAVL